MHSTERRGELGGRVERGTPWPAILGLSTVAAWAVTIPHAAPPFHEVVVFWFLAVCPGMAVVRVLRLRETLSQWILAVSLSIALDTILAMVQLYGRWWSPTGGFIALTIITLAGSVLDTALPNEAGEQVSTTTLTELLGEFRVFRDAKSTIPAEPPSRRRRTGHPMSRRWAIAGLLPALTILLLIGAAAGVVPQLPDAQTLDPRAGLSAFVETISGEGSAVVGIAVAALLGILLIERELEMAMGRAIPGAWAGCRNVAIALLIVVFGTVIGLRVACLASPLFCLGGASLP